MTTDALAPGDLAGVALGATVVLVVLGLLLGLLITKLIARLVIAVVVVVLAVLVWQQRSRVQDRVNSDDCRLGTTYFGIHIDAPQSVKDACNKARTS